MWISVRTRLLLTMAVVVLVALGTIALVATNSVQVEFQRYIDQDAERYQSLVGLVGTYSTQSTSTTQLRLEAIAQNYGERILLADAGGEILADSEGAFAGQSVAGIPPEMAMVLYVGMDERPVSPLFAIPAGQDFMMAAPAAPLAVIQAPVVRQTKWSQNIMAQDAQPGVPIFFSARIGEGDPMADPIETVFINSVTRSLWLAVAVAGVAAVGLTLMLSRGIIVPIEALTRAASQLEKGDLSQRVVIQGKDEIGRLAHAFNAMADGLMQLEQGRRQMVTDVAHELRTPLSNIRGYLEAVQDGLAQPDPEVIASLHEEAMVLTRLVDDLQELSLAEAHHLTLVRQPVALKPLVERVVQSAQGAGMGSAPIYVRIPDTFPFIEADPERLSQVVRNLVANALRYTPANGEIGIAARELENGVEVLVKDTGSGIASNHLPHIFDRFYRADPARARATGGAGLGLAIVKHLVELHGGYITVVSEVGEGTTFAVRLPLRLEKEDCL